MRREEEEIETVGRFLCMSILMVKNQEIVTKRYCQNASRLACVTTCDRTLLATHRLPICKFLIWLSFSVSPPLQLACWKTDHTWADSNKPAAKLEARLCCAACIVTSTDYFFICRPLVPCFGFRRTARCVPTPSHFSAILNSHQTRRGTTFAAFCPHATLLKSPDFDVGPLVQAAVSLEADEQEDIESAMDDLDEPPAPPIDDSWMDELDEPTAPRPAKRLHMAEVIASGRRPLPYAHIKRREKRNKTIAKDGQRPRPATLREHIQGDRAIPTQVDTSELPVAHGGYAAKAEDDTWGSKKRRSLPELINMGFELIHWDGMCVPCYSILANLLTLFPANPGPLSMPMAASSQL